MQPVLSTIKLCYNRLVDRSKRFVISKLGYGQLTRYSQMWPVATRDVAWSVSLPVGHDREPRESG